MDVLQGAGELSDATDVSNPHGIPWWSAPPHGDGPHLGHRAHSAGQRLQDCLPLLSEPLLSQVR